MFLTNNSPDLYALTLCIMSCFQHSCHEYHRIRMRIVDAITSRLFLIFLKISKNIKFSENLQPWRRQTTGSATGWLPMLGCCTHTSSRRAWTWGHHNVCVCTHGLLLMSTAVMCSVTGQQHQVSLGMSAQRETLPPANSAQRGHSSH